MYQNIDERSSSNIKKGLHVCNEKQTSKQTMSISEKLTQIWGSWGYKWSFKRRESQRGTYKLLLTQGRKRSETYFPFYDTELLNSVFLARKTESKGKSILKWQKISQQCYRVDWSHIYSNIFLKTKIHLVLINLLLYFSAKFLCL